MAGIEDIADADTEEALAEFNFLVSENNEGAGEAQSQGDNVDWGELQLVWFLWYWYLFGMSSPTKL